MNLKSKYKVEQNGQMASLSVGGNGQILTLGHKRNATIGIRDKSPIRLYRKVEKVDQVNQLKLNSHHNTKLA